MKITNFYYGDDFRKVPNVRAYGGMRVVKGKFGNYFELDLKDDDTEKFFKILGEQLQSLAGAYLSEKPWNLKSPIVEYGIFYSIHCGIPKNNKKRSHTQLDSRKQVIAFQDRVITINIKEAQHPLK